MAADLIAQDLLGAFPIVATPNLSTAFTAAGWIPRLTGQHGIWSWVSHDWPHHTHAQVGTRRVTWDGSTVTVQTVHVRPTWALTLAERVGSVGQAVRVLTAADVLIEAVTR
jgi:hypothetical protein